MKNYYKNYFSSIHDGLKNSEYRIKNKEIDGEDFFYHINKLLNKIKVEKGRIFFFGNGASAAFANHMALDFSKNGNILSKSLSDSALLTALSNDYSFESAFVEYLKIENINQSDLVITISSSGNSKNIINTLDFCLTNNIQSLTLSGLKSDNKSILKSNFSIYTPMKTYGMVECIHQVFLHLILDMNMEIFEWNRNEFQNMNSENFKL